MAGNYICPVCDRRLKTKHFCTYCKSFVRNPVFYTGPVANESYDSLGRESCMADQHYGLGHKSARSTQNSGRPQGRGENQKAKKIVSVFFLLAFVMVLIQVVFILVQSQSPGLLKTTIYMIPFTFFAQLLSIVLRVGFFALFIWVIVRNTRRK